VPRTPLLIIGFRVSRNLTCQVNTKTIKDTPNSYRIYVPVDSDNTIKIEFILVQLIREEMPFVTFNPGGVSKEIALGTSLLDAAEAMGVALRHDCGGFATCSTCRVLVVEGMSNLTEIDLDEENMLEEAALTAPHRLSCQAKIRGNVIVCIPDDNPIPT